jgi:hypothetical protein
VTSINLLPELLPGLVAPYHPAGAGAAGILSLNGGAGCRVVIPRSGTLTDLACLITASSGNLDAGVYDTSATTRNKLYSTGSIASPGTGWRILGNPGLAVTAGDHLDFVVATDNTTFAMARASLGDLNISLLPTNFLPAPLGGKPALGWLAGPIFPLPATIAESALGTRSSIPLIIARIT